MSETVLTFTGEQLKREEEEEEERAVSSEGELIMDPEQTEEKMGLLEEQEVTVKSKSSRKRTVYCRLGVVSLLLLVAVLIALAISIPVAVLLISSSSHGNDRRLSMEDLFDPSFQTRGFQGSWTPEGELVYQSPTDGVVLYSPADNSSRILLDAQVISELNVASVKLSPSGQYLLLIADTKKIYRHSFLGHYYIHKIDESLTWSLSTDILYGEWDPLNDILVYVKDYNIFIHTMQSNTTVQYTFNGEENGVYNGVPDWVYEEEILSTNYALWWSPNGQNILYCSFNDTQVEQFKFPVYGSSNLQYTHIDSIAYPKAGRTNPTVKVQVMNINEVGGDFELLAPEIIGGDYYVLSGVWINSSHPLVTWSNRDQNIIIHCSYDISTESPYNCHELYRQESIAWVEVVESPIFTAQSMLLIDSVPVGDDSFLHLFQLNLQTGESNPLTSGNWEVTDIIGATDEDILYISTESNSWQRHIYNSDGHCLTCDSTQWLDSCHYWSGSCSSDLSHCLLQCSGPAIPFTVLASYTENRLNIIVYFEQNEVLREAVQSIDLPVAEQMIIEGTSDEPPLYARILYPPDSTRSCNEKHSVLFYVYGGPYSQMTGELAVTSRLFPAFLCSHLNMMVVSVDGRGTGFHGNNYKYSVYRQLGILETLDQLRAARYFQEEYCYVDSDHFAIYGSSYGGYMSGMVAGSGSGLFTAAISQSPVTDWHYYDSIYTERYMQQPADNADGYKETSLLARAGNISSHYLLIHGTGDDNVHFQNTAQLVAALTEKDIQYQLMVYTDQDHSLSGGKTRNHLYQLITDFLLYHGF